MGAPKGNQFWKLRSSHGRKPIFASPEDLWNAAIEYFEWADSTPIYGKKKPNEDPEELPRPYTIDGLCLFLDISDETFRSYRDNKEFSGVYGQITKAIRDQKFSGAAAGIFNANIIARDLGLKEATENTHTGPQGGPIEHDHEFRVTVVSAPKENDDD